MTKSQHLTYVSARLAETLDAMDALIAETTGEEREDWLRERRNVSQAAAFAKARLEAVRAAAKRLYREAL